MSELSWPAVGRNEASGACRLPPAARGSEARRTRFFIADWLPGGSDMNSKGSESLATFTGELVFFVAE
jgi:hypothetical protein